MHPYVTNSKERVRVVVCLALLSVIIMYGFHVFLSKAGILWPWWLEAPSVWGVFGVLYRWFDIQLWRFPWLRKIRIVEVPDLNGQWRVQGYSATDEKSFTGKVFIQQTWTQISITMETEYSRSHSLTASLLLNQPDGTTLSYEYRNEPKANAPSTMHAHRGTAVLYLSDNNSLEGEYYSGRDRQNYGTLQLAKNAK